MTAPILEQVLLAEFKTYKNVRMPLDAVTALTGRNSSGKSNALDALEVLSRLASGEELAEALDGRRRQGGAVRGGSRGCAPHGSSSFTLGCAVRTKEGKYDVYITVQVEPELRIVHEELYGPAPALKSGRISHHMLMWTPPPDPESTFIKAEVHNGKRGVNPQLPFRDTRMLLSQVPLRLTPSTAAEEAVVRGAEAVTAALRGVFHLDPVPQLMRDYVPERDDDLRRTGENLSAAVGRLRQDHPEAFEQLRALIEDIADHRVSDLDVTRSPLGDVMLGVIENGGFTPAREMSDGLLRFMAIAVALLAPNNDLDIAPALSETGLLSPVTLVIEELENGLHPSQAERALRLVREASQDLLKRVVLTTHSPALLNAMTGELNSSVLVCYRDENTGSSSLNRITELPGYAEALASGPLGDAVTRDRLTRPANTTPEHQEFDRLLGIDLTV